MTQEQLESLEKCFEFKYVGGGYFRDNTVPKGKTAPLLHGDEVVREVFKRVKKSLTEHEDECS
jgi:hypothetical protein